MDTCDFKCHSCLHPPESKKEEHKCKLCNFDYKRLDKFWQLGDMLNLGGGAEESSINQISTGQKTD